MTHLRLARTRDCRDQVTFTRKNGSSEEGRKTRRTSSDPACLCGGRLQHNQYVSCNGSDLSVTHDHAGCALPGGGRNRCRGARSRQGSVRSVKQPVVIDNRPGANGALGSAAVAKSRPDGYTLVMGGVNTHAMNDSLLKPRPYNSAKDFAPITLTAVIPIAFVVNPELPVATLQELVALARSKPRQLSYGSSGTGGPQHLAMELFKLAAGIDIVHVPYKGGAPQLNDLIGGHILIGSIGLPPALPHIGAGKLRALAGPTPNAPYCCRRFRQWRSPAGQVSR